MKNIISTDLLSNFLTGMAEYLPRILGAFLLLLVGNYIAKKIAKLISNLLIKTGIDKYGDSLKEIPFVEKSNINVNISNIIGNFVFILLFLFFIVTAIEVLNLEAISELVLDLIAYLPFLFSGVIVLIAGTLLAIFIKKSVYTACKSIGMPSASIISNIIFYVLFISVAMSALEQAQFETKVISNNLSLILGGVVLAFAIGYGLASKQMVSNQLNSLYYKKEFTIGQKISIGDTTGNIVDMNSNNVVVEAGSKRIIIPFNRFSEENITIHQD